MLRTRFVRNFDWILCAAMVLLIAIGILVIWSTTFKATGSTGLRDVIRQSQFALIGLLGFIMASRIDYRSWSRLAGWLYGLVIIMLIWVLLFSRSVLGAQRWIDFGFFQFQPSEFAKLVLIVVLAKYFADNYDKMHQPKYLAISLGILAVPMLLVVRQPDLGTALVLVAIWIAMALVSPVRKVHLAVLAGIGVAMAPLFFALLKPFQRARLETFINPTADPLHTGYNAVQSTITVGSGQLFGRGLGGGSQSQLNFLPSLAQHTDFIFAVLNEKMGFVGGSMLLLLYGVLMWRGIRIANTARDRFGMFLAVGVVAMFLFHVMINTGMNMGVAPVTGIPLPLVSYGGTSLIVVMASLGLLQSVAIRRQKSQFEG